MMVAVAPTRREAAVLNAAQLKEIAALLQQLSPEQIDQVILGCVGQVAEDGYIARHASLKAGMPNGTPAYTVNRICGSGLEAINTAARYIQTGDASVVVAGGERLAVLASKRSNGRGNEERKQ